MKESLSMFRARWCTLAMIAALVLVFGVLSTPAFGDELYVGSWKSYESEQPTVPGVTYDKASNTLTLNNVELTTDRSMSGGIMYVSYDGSKNLTIKLIGSNKIHLSYRYQAAIKGETDDAINVKITGGGSLTVTGGQGALVFLSRGRNVDGDEVGSWDTTIDGVTLSTDTTGIQAGSGKLTIKDSNITINSEISDYDGFYALENAKDISVQNSRVEVKHTVDRGKLLNCRNLTMTGVKAYTGKGTAQCSMTKSDLYDSGRERYWLSGTYLLFSADDLGLPACIKGDPSVTFSPSSLKYNGKSQRPKVVVKVNGAIIDASSYDVEWFDYGNGAAAVGDHGAWVTLKGKYIGSGEGTYKVVKGINPLVAKAKVKTKTFSYAKVKAKTQSVKLTKLISVSKAAGKVTYKKKYGNKKIAVKGGKLYVKKGLKKGKYTVKIAVTAAGNGNYNKGTKVVSFKVKVK